MLPYIVRRAVHGAFVLFVIALFAYGLERALRPENYPGQAYLPHVWHDVQRALLHMDFGRTCGWAGCPRIHTLWLRGLAGDLWMLGLSSDAQAAIERRPGSPITRVVESTALVAYCAPVFVVGLGLILLFSADFGVWPVPYFFDVRPATYVSPLANPWDWFRSYLIPWLVVAAPLAGACMRVTLALTLEELDTDHVRTAIAKGLRPGRVLRRHAATGAYPAVASLVWGSIPMFVTNVVLVEWVFDVPGFWFATKRALGKDPSFPGLDIPMLQALTLWSALVIVVLSTVADVALAAIDPRVRAAGRP